MKNPPEALPSLSQPKSFMRELGLETSAPVYSLLDSTLFSPLDEFLKRPSKNIRGRLVDVGFKFGPKFGLKFGPKLGKKHLTSDLEILLNESQKVIEQIHAASLVVDDIQDNSEYRRGKPCLHRTLGIPAALNAGNWLYFWPLQRIQIWGVSNEVKLALYASIHQALLDAHFGQAIDVGTRIHQLDQKDIFDVCIKSLELKTGALTRLALQMGAILSSAEGEVFEKLSEFGMRFGVALQMFDDVGNFVKEDPKRFEDLRERRPSWVWAVVASSLNTSDFNTFIKHVGGLPESGPLVEFVEEKGIINLANQRATEYLDRLMGDISTLIRQKSINESEKSANGLSGLDGTSWVDGFQELYALGELLKKSYV